MKISFMVNQYARISGGNRLLYEYAKKWNNHVFRNSKINEWGNYARKQYAAAMNAKTPPPATPSKATNKNPTPTKK